MWALLILLDYNYVSSGHAAVVASICGLQMIKGFNSDTVVWH